jgi:hypothetical protein
LRSLVDTLPDAAAAAAEPRRDPDEILATGADPQLDTALAAIRARVLRSAKPTAVAEAMPAAKPASEGTQTP